MKRWIVNAVERTVRDVYECHRSGVGDQLGQGEFVWDGTYADAMASGARRRLAEEALDAMKERYPYDRIWIGSAFTIIADRIEPQAGGWKEIQADRSNIADCLRDAGFDVWREGTGLVVLGRLSG